MPGRVQDGGVEAGDRNGQSVAIVAEHRAQPHERVVDLAHLGRGRLLVPADRTDEVAAQARRGHREAVEADAGEAVAHAVERRPAGRDDEHLLAGADELAQRVDDGLRTAGARQRRHREGVTGGDAGQHRLLLGIRVEEERVRGGRAVVRTDVVRDGARCRDLLAIADVAAEGVEDRVVEAAAVLGHGASDIGEGGDDESRLDGERLDRSGQTAQAVDHRLRLEDAAVVGERREG